MSKTRTPPPGPTTPVGPTTPADPGGLRPPASESGENAWWALLLVLAGVDAYGFYQVATRLLPADDPILIGLLVLGAALAAVSVPSVAGRVRRQREDGRGGGFPLITVLGLFWAALGALMFQIRLTVPPAGQTLQQQQQLQDQVLGAPTTPAPATPATPTEGFGANTTTYIALLFLTFYCVTALLAAKHAYDREDTAAERDLVRQRDHKERQLHRQRQALVDDKAQLRQTRKARKASGRAQELEREATVALAMGEENDQIVAHARALGDPEGTEILLQRLASTPGANGAGGNDNHADTQTEHPPQEPT